MKCLALKLLHNSNQQHLYAQSLPTKRQTLNIINDKLTINESHDSNNDTHIHHNHSHTRGISLFNHKQSVDWTNIMQNELNTLNESDESDVDEKDLNAMLEITNKSSSTHDNKRNNRNDQVSLYNQRPHTTNRQAYNKPSVAVCTTK